MRWRQKPVACYVDGVSCCPNAQLRGAINKTVYFLDIDPKYGWVGWLKPKSPNPLKTCLFLDALASLRSHVKIFFCTDNLRIHVDNLRIQRDSEVIHWCFWDKLLQSLVLFQIASTVSTMSTVSIIPTVSSISTMSTLSTMPRSQNNLETLDLDTLLGLKDLEIAQLAHHLRPIFGLVIQISPFMIPKTGFTHLGSISQIKAGFYSSSNQKSQKI